MAACRRCETERVGDSEGGWHDAQKQVSTTQPDGECLRVYPPVVFNPLAAVADVNAAKLNACRLQLSGKLIGLPRVCDAAEVLVHGLVVFDARRIRWRGGEEMDRRFVQWSNHMLKFGHTHDYRQ